MKIDSVVPDAVPEGTPDPIPDDWPVPGWTVCPACGALFGAPDGAGGKFGPGKPCFGWARWEGPPPGQGGRLVEGPCAGILRQALAADMLVSRNVGG
jgi:hypothetical protein